jgi:hypothetical protein
VPVRGPFDPGKAIRKSSYDVAFLRIVAKVSRDIKKQLNIQRRKFLHSFGERLKYLLSLVDGVPRDQHGVSG